MKKECYKKVMSSIRLERRNIALRRAHLIHLLINLKSNRAYIGNIYADEKARQQLRWILKGNKVWNGDVWSWFTYNYHPSALYNPVHGRPKRGSRHKAGRQEVKIDETPF